jgi:hypothetical protein
LLSAGDMPDRSPSSRALRRRLLTLGLAAAGGAALAASDGATAKARSRAGAAKPAAPNGRPTATSALPAAVAAIVGRSGVPAESFAFEARPVESGDARPLVSFPRRAADAARLDRQDRHLARRDRPARAGAPLADPRLRDRRQ